MKRWGKVWRKALPKKPGIHLYCTLQGHSGVCGVGSAWVHTTVQHLFPNSVSNCFLVLTVSFFSILWWAPHSSKKKWSWPSKYVQILSDISHSHIYPESPLLPSADEECHLSDLLAWFIYVLLVTTKHVNMETSAPSSQCWCFLFCPGTRSSHFPLQEQSVQWVRC